MTKGRILRYLQRGNPCVCDLIYVGKYQGHNAYLEVYDDYSEVGLPYFVYVENKKVCFVNCFDGGEAQELYEKYIDKSREGRLCGGIRIKE